MNLATWAEQTQGRNTAGRREMHEAGVVADIERAAFETGVERQQLFGPNQVNPAIFRDAASNRLSSLPLLRATENRNACTFE